MGESTGIGWTDHTFNPWMGCQRVSPGCGGAKGVGGCYAEALVTGRMGYHAESADPRRRLTLWGPPSTSTRQRTSAANWKRVVQWDREAKAAGVRRRMFCASLADVFEAHPDLTAIRADLWPLLASCTSLDVQLLTKRPENITAMVPRAWRESWPAHVWIGTTVEDQRRANERIPHLLKVPAAVRCLSCEPLLEAVNLTRVVMKSIPGAIRMEVECDGLRGYVGSTVDQDTAAARGLQWVIVGGESGTGARPFDLGWARSIVEQCSDAGVPVFVKQMGDAPRETVRDEVYDLDRSRPVKYRRHHGADPSEWPADLRVQRFPAEVRNGR